MFQLINLSPVDITLKAGDRIGQGIIRHYGLVENDSYNQGAARVDGFGSTSEIELDNPFADADYSSLDESILTASYPKEQVIVQPPVPPNEIFINQETNTPFVEYYDGSRL